MLSRGHKRKRDKLAEEPEIERTMEWRIILNKQLVNRFIQV